MGSDSIILGDALEQLKTFTDKSIDCCITSPPYYGLRDYGVDKQIGLEETPEEYVEKLTAVFHEVKRVLKDDGTLWLNIGDSYWGSGSRGFDFTDKFTEASKLQQGSKGTIDLHNLPKLVGSKGEYKNKDLIGIPWMLAFSLRADGWYLRQDIIWHKPNPMPESVKDRCTKSHEYIFLLSKRPHYYFDCEAICDPVSKANKRDVWSVTTKAVKEAHFATFPEELVKPCILAGCRDEGVVLDPFFGSGTTGVVAESLNRRYIGVELNPDYVEISKRRVDNVQTELQMYGGA